MDNDGEAELSEKGLVQNYSESSSNVQASISDSFLDEFLKSSQTCTHTHMCNSPGPEFSHSHTCFHTHTHFIPSEMENTDDNDFLEEKKSEALKPRRVPGNREAVRKYREKKKAQTVYLEEEVKKLRFLNEQLIKKVERQGLLEREIVRLRCVLVNLKGKIDIEVGDFPYLKQSGSSADLKEGGCGVQSTCGFNPLPTPLGEITRNGCEQMVADFRGNCQSSRIDFQSKVNGPSREERH